MDIKLDDYNGYMRTKDRINNICSYIYIVISNFRKKRRRNEKRIDCNFTD